MLPITMPGFDRGLPLRMVMHTFQINANGELEHFTDEQLRATVPPEGWESYVETWPQCADMVAAATKPTKKK